MIRSNTSKMKSPYVVIVSETFRPEINGVANTLGYWVDGLIEKGIRVQVIRPRQTSDDQGSTDGALTQTTVTGLPIPKYSELKFGLPAPGLFRRLWNKEKPDAVYVATEGPLGYSAAKTARKLGIPVTSGFHTNFQSYSQFYGFGLLEKLILGYLRRFHNQTNATLVPTTTQKEYLESRGFKDVKVISRGVDCQRYHPNNASDALRNAWRASAENPVFIYVGRLAHEKNVLLIADSFNKLQTKHPEATLVFVGDGPARPELEQACPNAIFAGMKRGEDLAACYASGDIFLFPSKTDTFGNVVTEAMASGLAVIGFEDAAVKELIRHEENGYVVPIDDDGAFVDAMYSAYENKAQLSEIRKNSLALAKSISWEEVTLNFAHALSLPPTATQAPETNEDNTEDFSYGNA